MLIKTNVFPDENHKSYEKKQMLFPYFLMEGVYLKPLYPKHASTLLKVVLKNKEYFSKWLCYTGSLESLQETKEFLEDKVANRKSYEFYLGIWRGNKLIGNLELYEKDPDSRELHLGYWMNPSQQGKGLITKGCAFLIRYALTNSTTCKIIIACRQDNERSQSVAKRLGFSLVNDYWCQKTGATVTSYELLKLTWLESKLFFESS